MKRNTLVGLVGVAVLVAAVWAYMAFPVSTPPSAAEDPTLTSGTYKDATAYYTIDASYPTGTPLKASVSARADAIAVGMMKDFVDSTVAQFKRDGDFANLTPKDIEIMGLGEDNKYELRITHLSSASPRTVSYVFDWYAYTLGAHGNTFFRTFTFDTTTGASLKLADLFVPNAPYLDALSKLSREKLPSLIGQDSYDRDMIAAGTGPEEKNFENFFLDGTSLVILFPPYAVAAYAAGPQTLAIPVTSLKDLLKPEYQ